MLKLTQISTLIFTLLILNACGGGGGSTPAPTATTPTPSPTTPGDKSSTPASITNSNVDALAASFVNSVSMSFGAVIGRNLNISNNIGNDYIAQDSGCFNGIANVTYTLASTAVTGKTDYSEYDNCFAVRLNGNADISGSFTSSNTIQNITIQLNNIQVFRLSDGLSFTLSGTMQLIWKPSVAGSAEYQLVLNTTITNVQDSSIYKFENFTIDSRLAAGVNYATLSGRFSHSEHGYIDVINSSEMTFQHFNLGPSAGVLTLIGAAENAEISYSSFIPSVTITPIP